MKRLVILAIVFIALQAMDAGLTIWAVNHGFHEVNTLVAPIAHSWLLVVAKVLPAILAGLWIRWMYARFAIVRPVFSIGLSVAVVFYVVILASNLYEVIV